MRKKIKVLILLVCIVSIFINSFEIRVSALGLTYSPSYEYSTSSYYNAVKNVVLTGNQRTDIVNVAKSQVGYREGSCDADLSGWNDGSHSYNNYCEYNYWYWGGYHNGGSGYPWCAVFVSWCARQAGIPTSVIKNSAGAGASSSYFNIPYYSGSSYTPKEGDLFFTQSWSHVGIVTGVSGNSFYTVEGNTSPDGSNEGSGVYARTRYGFSNYYFGVPNYSGDAYILPGTGVPNAPTNLKSEKTCYSTSESINFSWNPSVGATDYWVYLWKDGVQLYASDVGNNTSHTCAPLGEGKYTLICRAGNSIGYSDSPCSCDFIVANSEPGPIIDLTGNKKHIAQTKI